MMNLKWIDTRGASHYAGLRTTAVFQWLLYAQSVRWREGGEGGGASAAFWGYFYNSKKNTAGELKWGKDSSVSSMSLF